MKKSLLKSIKLCVALVSVFCIGFQPALATSTVPSAQKPRVNQLEQKINYLNAALNRVKQMQDLENGKKNSLSSEIQGVINQFNKSKTDSKNISVPIDRTYAVLLPKARIMASADRSLVLSSKILELTSQFEIKTKDFAQTGGNASTINSKLNEIKIKAAAAEANAQAAIALVQYLEGDFKDKKLYNFNKKALSDARAKIKAAANDLKLARKHLGDAVKIVKSFQK